MNERIPGKWRMGLYIFTGVMSPVFAVLCSPDVHILPYWAALIWAGEVTFIGALASSNVKKPDPETDK